MWRLHGSVAQLEGEVLSAAIDSSSPDLGIRGVRCDAPWGRGVLDSPVLKLRIAGQSPATPVQLAETYVRDNDVVASYEELSNPHVRPQVYWRMLRPHPELSATGIEFILSVQTSTLDSRPTIVVESAIGKGELRLFHGLETGELVEVGKNEASNAHELASVVLFRPEASDVSYVELAYPGDFRTSIFSDNQLQQGIVHRLNSERLEKGVIRRCRLRGLLIPVQDDERLAAECYRAFLASQLPLTA